MVKLLAAALMLLISVPVSALQWRDEVVRSVDYRIVELEATDKLSLHWQDGAGKPLANFSNLKTHLAQQGKALKFATNAGIFMTNLQPLGLHVQQGKTLNRLSTRAKGYGNFYLQPNGVFVLGKDGPRIVTTPKYKAKVGDVLATQSGPMLLINGQRHARFIKNSPSRKIRSGVGVTKSGKIIFVLSRSRVNFYDFAELFKRELQCRDALYLDGSISDMYLAQQPKFASFSAFAGMLAVSEPVVEVKR